MSRRQRRVLNQLIGCRRGCYGSRTHVCQACDHGQITLNSCGNRHCVRCGDGRRAGWRDRMAEIALDCPYLHTVFTTPHELNALHDLDDPNSAAMIRLLFDCVSDTLSRVLERHGIGKTGAVMTLHTWGQRMKRHVHVHVVLTAGGLSDDGEQWVPLELDDDGLQEFRNELATEYRAMYLRRLSRRIKSGKIRMPGVADGSDPVPTAKELIEKLKRKTWIIDMQASPDRWKGSTGIVNYLASYVAGTAISDRRLVKDDGRNVTIKFKDYRTKRRTTETMLGEEFLIRFASHIMPLHCKRIRYLGLFAPSGRNERLEHCRRLITEWRGVPEEEEPEAVEEPLDQEQIRKALFIGEGNERRTFPATCRFCKGYMTSVAKIDGKKTMRLLPYLIVVMRWLAGKAEGPPEKQPFLLPDHFRDFVADELVAEERRRLAAPNPEISEGSSATFAMDAQCRPPPEAA